MSYSTLLKISIPLMFAQSVQFIMAWTATLSAWEQSKLQMLVNGITTNILTNSEVGWSISCCI